MAQQEEVLYYDIPHVASLPLSRDDVAALGDMFDQPGWGVFMRLRRFEARTSAQIALGLGSDDDDRKMHRALYHGFMGDLTLQERLEGAVRVGDAKPLGEIEAVPEQPDYDTLPLDEPTTGIGRFVRRLLGR